MARLVTLGQLKTDIIEQADLVSVTGDTFITETLLRRWIVQSSRAFGQLVMRAYGRLYEEQEYQIHTESGTARYSLAGIYDDLFHLLSVSGLRGGVVANLYPASREDLHFGKVTTGEGGNGCTETYDYSGSWPPRYRLNGPEIELAPVPTDGWCLKLRYLSTQGAFTNQAAAAPKLDMTADEDSIDGVNGWEQWIVWDVCVKAALKQQDDPSAFMAERQRVEAEILRSGKRDHGPRFVREVYEEMHYGRGPFPRWWGRP